MYVNYSQAGMWRAKIWLLPNLVTDWKNPSFVPVSLQLNICSIEIHLNSSINCDQSVTLCYLWRLSLRLRAHMFLEAKGLEIHYPSSYGLSGITVDEISEWHRKEENEDLAVHPAASRPAVQLSTRSFGRQQSSEGRSAVGGVVANGAIIENLIKMLKKLSVSSEQRRPPCFSCT